MKYRSTGEVEPAVAGIAADMADTLIRRAELAGITLTAAQLNRLYPNLLSVAAGIWQHVAVNHRPVDEIRLMLVDAETEDEPQSA